MQVDIFHTFWTFLGIFYFLDIYIYILLYYKYKCLLFMYFTIDYTIIIATL